MCGRSVARFVYRRTAAAADVFEPQNSLFRCPKYHVAFFGHLGKLSDLGTMRLPMLSTEEFVAL